MVTATGTHVQWVCQVLYKCMIGVHVLCMCWTCAHRHLHANLMYGGCGWTHPSREMTSVCPVKLLAIWRARSLASDLVGGGEGEGRGRGSGGEELMVNGSRGSLSLDTDTHACMAHRHTMSTCILSRSKHCTCTTHALHMRCTCVAHVLRHRHTITPLWDGVSRNMALEV